MPNGSSASAAAVASGDGDQAEHFETLAASPAAAVWASQSANAAATAAGSPSMKMSSTKEMKATAGCRSISSAIRCRSVKAYSRVPHAHPC